MKLHCISPAEWKWNEERLSTNNHDHTGVSVHKADGTERSRILMN